MVRHPRSYQSSAAGNRASDTILRLSHRPSALNVGAVYVITRRYKNSGSGISHDVLYVGDTLNLSLTLLNHPKWDCLIRGSANCIGAHIDEDQNSRVAKREDLIQQYAPACNP